MRQLINNLLRTCLKNIAIVAVSGAVFTTTALAQKSPVRTEPLLRSAPAQEKTFQGKMFYFDSATLLLHPAT